MGMKANLVEVNNLYRAQIYAILSSLIFQAFFSLALYHISYLQKLALCVKGNGSKSPLRDRGDQEAWESRQ